MQKSGNQEAPIEEWLETHANDVHDSGVLIKDAIEKIVDSLRNASPANPLDIIEVRQELENLKGSFRELENELNKLPS